MKIALASDLHLEFQDIDLPNTESAHVLILSGDIMVAEDLHRHSAPDPYEPGGLTKFSHRLAAAQRYRGFLDRVSQAYPHVVYVAGNHEFYHGRWHRTLDVLSEECARYPNVYFLERGVKTIDDVTFIGGTLWTNMNRQDPLTLHAAQDLMNDYKVIVNETAGYSKLKPADTCVRHREMLGYIKTMVAEQHETKFVVVGHHAPTPLSMHPRYANDPLMNGAYHSDLSEFILDRPQIKLWTHGHTHHPFDYMMGSTRVVCNPRGYAGHEPAADAFELKFLEI